MIQLADIYAFIVSHRYGTRKRFMADLLNEVLQDKDLYAHRYKEWPRG